MNLTSYRARAGRKPRREDLQDEKQEEDDDDNDNHDDDSRGSKAYNKQTNM